MAGSPLTPIKSPPCTIIQRTPKLVRSSAPVTVWRLHSSASSIFVIELIEWNGRRPLPRLVNDAPRSLSTSIGRMSSVSASSLLFYSVVDSRLSD